MNPSMKLSDNKFRRNWKFDENTFTKEFESTKWDRVLNLEEKDTDESFNTFFNIFNNILAKHLPLEKISKSQQKKGNRKPWISKGILTSMKMRDSFLKKSIKSKSDEQKNYFLSQYKLYRNMIVKLCRKSKEYQYINFFNENTNDIKYTWKGVNLIISSSKSKSKSPNSIIINKQVITDKKPLLTVLMTTSLLKPINFEKLCLTQTLTSVNILVLITLIRCFYLQSLQKKLMIR